jgi:uracil-DNA glycosylase
LTPASTIGNLGLVGPQNNNRDNNDWRHAAASALDWWVAAGVDVLVEDAPRDWMKPPARPAPAPAPTPVASAGELPDTWDAFAAWRAGPDAPDAGWRGAAIQASGPAHAKLMVLADCPDREDEPAGALLSGAAGRLFDRMLAAIDLSRAEVHLAAVCAKRPVAGRMPPELEERLHECARHHVALVAPKRLLLIGNAASRAILAADVPRTRGLLHDFNHKGVTIGAVATFHPRLLLEQPAHKAGAWRDLQLLMKGLER